MLDTTLNLGSRVVLPKPEFDLLLADLRQSGYQTVGPRLQDESIVYSGIDSLADLPRGVTTEQAPGKFRLMRTDRERYFDFIPGAQSWKQFLFPPRLKLFSASKEKRWELDRSDDACPRYALVGVRGCELAAIEIQDKAFLRDDFEDPTYRARREGLFIIAINCLQPAGTCFCASLGTGPRVERNFDLCLTELDDAFLVEIGSDLGRSLMAGRNFELASAFVQNTADQALARAAGQMGRTLDTSDLPDLLTHSANLDARHWDEVARRCLSCGNCTQVCPTCFCWDVTDTVNLTATTTVRERVWDSCFNPYFSYQAGGNTRPTIRSRYRQWLSHKFGTWVQQYGSLGCTGCGRCITWCPAGIDHVAEIAALREEVKE
ncbi:MAG: 4Fe-4S dicluster domain-containing protein [Anaerolineales bacterium]|nr:4Fe-4S dicluster domain-containing protein [Anaerolineales bacterium]